MPDFPSELVEAAAKALATADEVRLDNPDAATYWRHLASAVVPLIQQAERDRLAKQAGEGVQRLRHAIHTADRELITIADFSIQEAADAIDIVRAGLKDALAETDRSAQRDGPSVLDQSLQAVINRLATDVGEPPAGIVKAVASALLAQLPDARPGQVAIYGCDTDEDLADLLLRMAGVAASMVWAKAAACGVTAERARCPLCDHGWRRHDPEDGMCDCHDETAIGPCRCGRDLAWMQERIAAMSAAALSSPAEPDAGA